MSNSAMSLDKLVGRVLFRSLLLLLSVIIFVVSIVAEEKDGTAGLVLLIEGIGTAAQFRSLTAL